MTTPHGTPRDVGAPQYPLDTAPKPVGVGAKPNGAHGADESDVALLTDRELMARLRVSQSQFYRLKRLGRLKAFEVPRPLSRARYSRKLVEQYERGESLVQFIRRR